MPTFPDLTFEQFAADVRQRGCQEALVREWPANSFVDRHTHPFDATLLVVRGELTLDVAGVERRLRPGDTCEVPRNVAHAEKYGPEGATLWVGRAS